MDDKNPEWVFEQDEDDSEGESVSSSSSVVTTDLPEKQEETQQTKNANSLATNSEQNSNFSETDNKQDTNTIAEEHKTTVLAEDGSVIEEPSEPIWQEETTVFDDEEDFQQPTIQQPIIENIQEEDILVKETDILEKTDIVQEEPIIEEVQVKDGNEISEQKVVEEVVKEDIEKPAQLEVKKEKVNYREQNRNKDADERVPLAKKAKKELPPQPIKNVANSAFEEAGWAMFGDEEEEVVKQKTKPQQNIDDDADFMAQFGAEEEVEETEEIKQPEKPKQEVNVTKEIEIPQQETQLSTEQANLDDVEVIKTESVIDEEGLSEDSVLDEVDSLLDTDDLIEKPVEELNIEVENLLNEEKTKQDDGTLKQEEVFNKAPKLVLKRDKAEPKTSIVEDSVSDDDENFYLKILNVLEKSEDLGLTPATRQKITDAINSDILPQIAIKELISQRVIGKIQLARAATRSQGHLEIMSFLDIPAEATMLRKEMDPKAIAYLREHRIIPIKRETSNQGDNTLNLAYESTFRDLVKESDLRELLPTYNFKWHFALREVCGAFWLSGGDDDVDSNMEAEALLDRIVTNAIDARSSDIHIDPSIKGEPRAVVKYRIDGFVTPKEVITQDQLERVRVRIENIARMPKVNQNHPNKGAFTRAGFDWRVQIQPHAGRHGPVPRIVIRRLQPDVLPMETLGYPQYFIDGIKDAANSPNGVVFWTGPTGSGKTESIHSAIVSVNPMGKGLSVHTIEDPPEKRVSGYAVQMELSDQDPSRSGTELLKSSLRADPDVVIFGEVRDKEMANLVFEAANTGHLVFSTLHTNTALDAIVRLDELGIYGFLISYVRGIAAQRLIRRLCVHCRHPVKEMDEFTKSIFDKYEIDTEGAVLYKADPEGCASCNNSGYHGRIAICEWLTPSQELIEISARRDYEDLERVATAAGWKPMAYMGVLHIKNGITDAAELSSKVLELSAEV